MIAKRFDYINDRRTEDVQVVFEEERGREWIVSFVATVPHYCESAMIFGDLFDCPLAAIDHLSVPVARGSDKEAELIRPLHEWANRNMSPKEQHTLRHARFPIMSQEIALRRMILWFIDVLIERRKRYDSHREPGANSPAEK